VERHSRAWPELFRFSAVMTIEHVLRPKPDPDIYHQASAMLGLEASDCVIFEDSNPGMRAAIASGARAIMIPDLAIPEDEVRDGAACLYPSLVHALERRDEWF
jgi:beta-phosphoglucomutase-like phosphatase (HAD superfamily)